MGAGVWISWRASGSRESLAAPPANHLPLPSGKASARPSPQPSTHLCFPLYSALSLPTGLLSPSSSYSPDSTDV